MKIFTNIWDGVIFAFTHENLDYKLWLWAFIAGWKPTLKKEIWLFEIEVRMENSRIKEAIFNSNFYIRNEVSLNIDVLVKNKLKLKILLFNLLLKKNY